MNIFDITHFADYGCQDMDEFFCQDNDIDPVHMSSK